MDKSADVVGKWEAIFGLLYKDKDVDKSAGQLPWSS